MRPNAKHLFPWAALLVCTMFARGALGESLPDLAAKSKVSVVLLTISNAAGRKVASGTGFFVEGGRVVTNHHVIDGAQKVTATLGDGRKVDVLGVLADDEEKDLAVLKMPETGVAPLPLGQTKTLRIGDEIVVIGSPLGLSTSLSTGIVAAIRDEHSPLLDDEDDNGRPKKKGEKSPTSWNIQITAPISPGSSGSPIMTTSGEVVAVAVGQMVGGQGINFGIPVEEVKLLLLQANGGPLKAFQHGGGSDIRKNLLISAAFFGAIALLIFAVRRYDRRKLGPVRHLH